MGTLKQEMNTSLNDKAFYRHLATENHEKLISKMISYMDHEYQFRILKKDKTIIHAPFTLYPSPFSKPLYQNALDLQVVWNELVPKLSQSYEFIDWIVDRLLGKDLFVQRLYQIEQNRRQKQPSNVPSMVILRSDYMMHCPMFTNDELEHSIHSRKQIRSSLQLKQVEINTMASSFGTLSNQLHNIRIQVLQCIEPIMGPSRLPLACKSKDAIINGLLQAINYYNTIHNISRSIAIMVVQPHERNIFDQQIIIDELSNNNITMIRLDFSQISTLIYLDSSSILRCTNNEVPISLVYYRAGYVPSDYPTEQEWKCREMIECSIAIKCPSINTQIVGLKKTQQVLSEDGILEKYICNTNDISLLHNSFMKFYSFENVTSMNDPVIQMALDNPTNFVLKPQREGGGNNLTNQQLFDYLSDSSHLSELPAYILMEKIHAPHCSNILVRDNSATIHPNTISELGIFGSVLWESNIIYQESGGYLLRTKSQDVSEGGVAAGYAFIDSPWLIDPIQ